MDGNKTQIGVLQVLIILLTLFAAAVHLQLYFPDPMFILNGLGYLGLLGALFLPIPFIKNYRVVWRLLLMGYAALTFVMYFVTQGEPSTLAYVTKAAEVVLIVLLVLDWRPWHSRTGA
jgi:hypothetical protein